MNKIYGGLVSNPVNQKDTYITDNRTITFSGAVVETSTVIPEQIAIPEPPDYKNIVGSYVYADKTLGSEVKDGIVGVVAIPANACPDGKARIVPLTGATANLKWTNSSFTEYTDITNAGVEMIETFPYVNDSEAIGTTVKGYTAYHDNDIFGPLFWIEASPATIEYWLNNGINVIQSPNNPSLYTAYLFGDYGSENEYLKILPEPYLSDGSVNPIFSSKGGYSKTINTDWTSGETNKVALSSNSELFSFVNNFSRDGFPAGSWSIPTTAEQAFIFAKYETIKNAIAKANGNISWTYTPGNYKYLWSSTFIGPFDTENDTGGLTLGGYVDDYGASFYGYHVRDSDAYSFGLPLAKLNN